MDRVKLVLLTSNKQRHIWVANKVAERFNLAGIISEPKAEFYTELISKSKIIGRHFRLNALYEEFYLGEYRDFPHCDKLLIQRDDVNRENVVEWVKGKQPDIIMLYGTGLLKEPWFDNFQDRIINMHLGLSPYYRGSGTNLWPLVNREPEYVGVTIHIATLGVDDGDILWQIKPDIEITDNAYDIGMKAIAEGTRAFISGVKSSLGGLKPVPQRKLFDGKGKVYKRKDFDEQSVLTLWKNFNEGMIAEYLKDFKSRAARVPIVEPEGM